VGRVRVRVRARARVRAAHVRAPLPGYCRTPPLACYAPYAGAQQHKRELELLEAQRALSLLEAAREQDMAQLTKAVGTGREAAAALKAVQAAKDDNFTKLVVLRAELEAALRAQHESEGRSLSAAAALSAVELEVPEVRREAEEVAVVARREIGELKRWVVQHELSIAREKENTQQRSELLERSENEVRRLNEELAVLKSKHKVRRARRGHCIG
jgi:hypothetical protein